MTKKEMEERIAELNAEEQAVIVELAELREKEAALETKRERIRMERAIAYITDIRTQK